jgi:hypothetical protein
MSPSARTNLGLALFAVISSVLITPGFFISNMQHALYFSIAYGVTSVAAYFLFADQADVPPLEYMPQDDEAINAEIWRMAAHSPFFFGLTFGLALAAIGLLPAYFLGRLF